MSIKITTLVENSVYGKGLQGEHGLSLLVARKLIKKLKEHGWIERIGAKKNGYWKIIEKP